MFGKWHLGAHPPYHPQRRGFDEFFGFLREGHYFLPAPFDNAPDHVVAHLRPVEPQYNRLNPILRGEAEVEEREYLTDAFAREALSFIERQRGRPWFLYLPFNAAHSPMQATPRDYARYAQFADHHRRVWAAMVGSMDAAIGRILARLEELDLRRQTLVVYLSDNGGPTQELTSRNDPFSGGKGSLREGGIRIPFLMSWPGMLPAGVVEPRPVSALDIVPTSLAAARVEARPPAPLDGVNLIPFLTGADRGLPHDTLYWRMGRQHAIRYGEWKLARFRSGEADQLFDLAQDVKEEHDLAAAQPDRVRDLKARYEAWDRQLIEPLWTNTGPPAKP
jgi:arylsulfatase B